MKLISVVMPALNEEQAIVKSIYSIPKKGLEESGYNVEIIVVDGGSHDKTVELAKKSGAKVISSPKGYGRQYKEGFKVVQGNFIITGDSDGTYPFEDIVEYLTYFESQSLDFISVNRFAIMESGAMHLSNRIGNIGLTLFTNILFGLNLKDSQSGMWIIKRDILKKLNITSNEMPFSQEIKIEAFKKVRSKEINGRYKRRIGETKLLKIRDGIGNLKALFKKRFEI